VIKRGKTRSGGRDGEDVNGTIYPELKQNLNKKYVLALRAAL